jgi:hypothetical protein
MKLTEQEIRQAFVHPDHIVRDVALRYFALSFSRDHSIMPVAIQAIEEYGWEEAFFHSVWMVQNLPQTDATLLWLVGQLDGPSRLPESTTGRICSAISHTDAELLGRHESRLTDCKSLDGPSRKIVHEKIRLLSVPSDACWKELEDLCEQHKNEKDSKRFEFRRATRLVEAISREGHKYTERVLFILSQKIENFESNPLVWLEIFVAHLAGLIRLESSAPLLAAKLKDDDGDFINEECTYALTKIGGDAAVEAIAKDFHAAPSHFRLYASSALRDMRGENVVAKALELLQGKEDWDTQAKFIGTALANFSAEGLRVAKEFGIDDLPELRRELIATAVLTGEDFPDLERLREEEREHQAKVQRRQEWLFGGFQKTPKPSVKESADEPVVQPIESGPKTGRNEPCPCGSGKKYKKCCLRRD